MPRFDGTGPRGKGSLSGRGMGYCVVEQGMQVNDMTPRISCRIRGSAGFGGRRGCGLGRGRRMQGVFFQVSESGSDNK